MVARTPEAMETKKMRDAQSKKNYKANNFVSVQSTVHESQRHLIHQKAKMLRKQYREQVKKKLQRAREQMEKRLLKKNKGKSSVDDNIQTNS